MFSAIRLEQRGSTSKHPHTVSDISAVENICISWFSLINSKCTGNYFYRLLGEDDVKCFFISVQVLPFLQQFSSASSLWIVSFIDLFFSFSFSYFFFHCSAVSSRFTDTVFLMVLALIGGIQWGREDRKERKQHEGRVRGKYIDKREKRESARQQTRTEKLSKQFPVAAARWKYVSISLTGMQIGFLPTLVKRDVMKRKEFKT